MRPPTGGLRRLRLVLVCLRSFGRRLTFPSITGSTMACGQSPLRPLTPSCTTQTGQATPRAQRHLRQLPLLPNNRHHSRPVLSKHACGVVTSSTRTAVIFVLLSRCLAWPCDLAKPVNSKSRRHGAPLRFLKSGHTTFNPLSLPASPFRNSTLSLCLGYGPTVFDPTECLRAAPGPVWIYFRPSRWTQHLAKA